MEVRGLFQQKSHGVSFELTVVCKEDSNHSTIQLLWNNCRTLGSTFDRRCWPPRGSSLVITTIQPTDESLTSALRSTGMRKAQPAQDRSILSTAPWALSPALGTSAKTVHTYRSRLLEKLSARTDAEICQFAFANRLVDVPPEQTS